jgi:hypothetical protein
VWTDGHISLIIVQFWAGCVSQVVLWGALAVVAVASIAFVAVVPRGITPQARILPQTGKCVFLCKPASICSWVQWVRSNSLTRLRWAELPAFAAFATLDGCSSAQVTQQLDAVLCIPATDQECHKCADNCKKFAEMKKARSTPSVHASSIHACLPPPACQADTANGWSVRAPVAVGAAAGKRRDPALHLVISAVQVRDRRLGRQEGRRHRWRSVHREPTPNARARTAPAR